MLKDCIMSNTKYMLDKIVETNPFAGQFCNQLYLVGIYLNFDKARMIHKHISFCKFQKYSKYAIACDGC